jgi:hypothetical protein
VAVRKNGPRRFQGDQRAELLEVLLDRRCAGVSAGVVNQDVDRADLVGEAARGVEARWLRSAGTKRPLPPAASMATTVSVPF